MNFKMSADRYDRMVKQAAPKSNLGKNCLNAFWVGGLLCVVAQGINDLCIHNGCSKDAASTWALLGLIFLAAILTALNVFDKIGRFAGAGTLVPITGFANSVVSAGMEFKTEGLIFGTGSKIFTLAGPVVVYGVVFSMIYGVILLLLGKG